MSNRETDSAQDDSATTQFRRKCTRCGDEWTVGLGDHSAGYDCFGCGAPSDEIETLGRVDDAE